MPRKLLTKQALKPTLTGEQLQTSVGELTEQDQEAISGGSSVAPSSIGFAFPCDGPGRGGTCGEM